MSAPWPDGVRWLRWDEDSERALAETGRPVLVYIADPLDALLAFHKAVFNAIPRNAKLRALLGHTFPALFLLKPEVPEMMAAFGAGERYHLAIVSPHGFNPLVTFDPTRGTPEQIADEIAATLETMAKA